MSGVTDLRDRTTVRDETGPLPSPDTSAPTLFQLWLVQQTGVSVADQELMTTDEWVDRFGELSARFPPWSPTAQPAPCSEARMRIATLFAACAFSDAADLDADLHDADVFSIDTGDGVLFDELSYEQTLRLLAVIIEQVGLTYDPTVCPPDREPHGGVRLGLAGPGRVCAGISVTGTTS